MPKMRKRTKTRLFCSECLKMLGYANFSKYHDTSTGRTKYFSYCRKCSTVRSQRYRKRNPEWYIMEKKKKRCTKRGITVTELDILYMRQGFRCAICGVPESELQKVMAIDHDHETGKARGLLCEPCNIMLGSAKDNPDVLKAGISYLENSIALSKAKPADSGNNNSNSKSKGK